MRRSVPWACARIARDGHGRLVWWMDFHAMDITAICQNTGRISVQSMARYMVWLAHLLLLDERAQGHGFVGVQYLNHVSLFQTATLVPTDVSPAMDRLTIGVLPLKMKQMIIYGADRWMHLLLGQFKPFMSQKLRQRIRIVTPSATMPKASLQTYWVDPTPFVGIVRRATAWILDERVDFWKVLFGTVPGRRCGSGHSSSSSGGDEASC
jgi:CRAL/TRIO domain